MRHARLAAVFAAVLMAGPVAADGVAGPYLAARQADMRNDFAAAQLYLSRALARDRNNDTILRDLVFSKIALGDIDGAAPLARQLDRIVPDDEIAGLVATAITLKTATPGEVLDFLQDGPRVGPMIDGLLTAWAEVSAGRMSVALDRFDQVADNDSMRSFAMFHKAMALAVVGDFEAAEATFSGMLTGEMAKTRRGVLALAQLQSQLDRRAEAIALLQDNFGPGDAEAQAMIATLSAGQAVPFDLVRTPRDGFAEVFYSVAAALSGQSSDRFALMYLRLAEYLAPHHTDAILLGAGLLEGLGQIDLAVEAYGAIPATSPVFVTAEIDRAQALNRADRVTEGIAVLQSLADRMPARFDVQQALGDALRRDEQFEAARQAYDRAIALLTDDAERNWVVFYARGVTHERTKNWPAAEADFRKALALSPGQPLVLNYLGYSFVERGENLDEALDMIRDAVEARPDNGFITDSLGWVLFRLGDYDAAVAPMERAAELTPSDPVINDHLGDVYWAVGRVREARFQWHRALSFDPEPDAADRIRRKLEVGLDKVLQEEGAAPLRAE